MILRFILAMVIPLWVTFYTIQFGRWMHKRHQSSGAISAFAIAAITFAVTGVVMWRVFW